mmetsp:Transcript_68553/g.174051  ORF Transcript_68553/g.174051 Transcript_68553/m.174051 type:complete len:231 (+) Transcript_68553:122-814(+)
MARLRVSRGARPSVHQASRLLRLCALAASAAVVALLRPRLGFVAPSPVVLRPLASSPDVFLSRGHRQHGATSRASSAKGETATVKKYIPDSLRNILFIAGIGGTVAASWWFTGKWWKYPLCFAIPSMLYRLWSTGANSTKLAEVSASVDMKYVASTEAERKALHSFMCGGCGYTLFPARGREAAFFTANFKCPMCGAAKDEFFDMNEDDDDATPTAKAAKGGEVAPKPPS